MSQEIYSFACPYCFQMLSIAIDLSAGKRQMFTYDCEICCHPITIKLTLSEDGICEFDATPES